MIMCELQSKNEMNNKFVDKYALFIRKKEVMTNTALVLQYSFGQKPLFSVLIHQIIKWNIGHVD